MNERIKELAKKSGLTLIDSPIWKSHVERFTNLVIQDCINKVEDLETDSRNHISYILKQHYGVE